MKLYIVRYLWNTPWPRHRALLRPRGPLRQPGSDQLSGPGGTPIGLRGAPCGPVVSLRRRLPARLPRWPPFAADGPSSFAGCTRSIRSPVPAVRGVMWVVAFITEGRVIRRILEHLGASARRATQDRAPPPAAAAVPVSP